MVDALDVVRFVVGAAILAWLPGYVWTRVLLPRLDAMERFVVAVAFSVTTVTLFLYGGNVAFGVRISAGMALLGALLITAAGLVPFLARTLRGRLDRWTS